ncbi:MAG: sigma-70 family RNA polymerase sigma factor [Planctomycetes bacterium]|jgi:RNA polymerase sigma-70 factor (ECF subfamily)|nr:sigma-70 family RNA polymerase sigma factor [Planctomycetota bacterium]
MTDDRELVRQALSGSGPAFETLVERYQDRVYRVALRYLGRHQDAEETAQETFMRAFTKLETYDAERPFPTWLLSICANAARDTLRRRGRRPEAPMPESDPPDRRPGPARGAVEREEAERLREAVARLDEEKRLAVVLRYFEGLSLAEIADVTGTEVATLKVRLFRARQELFRMMEE